MGFSFESAPSAPRMGSAKSSAAAVSTSARITVAANTWNMERLASSCLPFPISVATYAQPPVANMNAIAPKALNAGDVMLSAARASVPRKLDTKIPSTTLYDEMNTIITIDGTAKRMIVRGVRTPPRSSCPAIGDAMRLLY